MSKWTKVGVIGVDAGICWIGDPCYILHTDKPPQAIGESWLEFCSKLAAGDSTNQTATQFNYDHGRAGLGVVVQTGYGDGTYPVYVNRNAQGVVIAALIRFAKE